MAAVTAAYLLYLFAPIILLLVGSFGETWTNSLLPSGITTRWYLELANDSSFQRAFFASLKVVAAVCAINTLITVPLAYAIHTGAHAGIGMAVRISTLMPIAAPELVLAFGFILVFSSDTLPWLGSIWLLIAGHVVLTMPYLLNTLLADMRGLALTDIERTAAALGAGFWQRFVDVVLPSMRYSLLSGLITVTAISIGEFQFSNLVAGFLNRTYPILLLQAFYGATGFACAATVILLGLAMTAGIASAITAYAARKAQAQ